MSPMRFEHTLIPLINRGNIHSQNRLHKQENPKILCITAREVAPLIHTRRQAHSKVLVATLAILELCLGKAVMAMSFVLVEACQEVLFVLGDIAEFAEGVGELVATAGVSE